MVIDYASNFSECLLTTDIRSGCIAKWLETVFAPFDNPDELVWTMDLNLFLSLSLSVYFSQSMEDAKSKNDTHASPHVELSAFLRKHGIAHLHSAVYNPTENGLVEVFNQVLKYGVQCFRHDEVAWEEGIQELLKTYHVTPARPGSKSPAEVFFRCMIWLDFELAQVVPAVLRIYCASSPEICPWVRPNSSMDMMTANTEGILPISCAILGDKGSGQIHLFAV